MDVKLNAKFRRNGDPLELTVVWPVTYGKVRKQLQNKCQIAFRILRTLNVIKLQRFQILSLRDVCTYVS